MPARDLALLSVIIIQTDRAAARKPMRSRRDELERWYHTGFCDVPDIVCQEYAVPHMQDLIPKIPGGYVSVRLTPPTLNNIFPKPPPVPPPPEKYYAATAICKSSTTPTTPSNQQQQQQQLNAYSDLDLGVSDDDLQLSEYPRDKLVIVEKLGCGAFGELHLCETKGYR
uniref:Uncharacterized protein n=1 Tax=Anopheles maculatus TaxID=74869 RepID=A0A182SLA2_9DIPT